MAKRKRRHSQISQPPIIATTFQQDNEALDNVLAEMETASLPLLPTTSPAQHKITNLEHEDKEIDHQIVNFSVQVPSPLTHAKQLDLWSTQLAEWLRHPAVYPPNLLPSFDVEVARHFAIQDLSNFLLDSCKNIKMSAFERWLIDSKAEELQRQAMHPTLREATDVVLSGVKIHYPATKRLMEELHQAGLDRQGAKKVLRELCFKTNQAISQIILQAQNVEQTPLKKGDRLVLEKKGQFYTLVYRCKRWKKPFCAKIKVTHYEKLRQLFVGLHPTAWKMEKLGRPTMALHVFHLLIMVLLVRYSSLAGGQLLQEARGGGMQGAVHGGVFEVSRQHFAGPIVEGFASPLNCCLPTFGSAFYDIDKHFGSVGNFFQQEFTNCCVQVNPPFAPGLMQLMVQHIDHSLKLANEQASDLTFVVIVPTVRTMDFNDTMPVAKREAMPSFRRLVEHEACSLHIILASKEHGYVEGSQHLRPTQYKTSLFETSVVVLQSHLAKSMQLDETQFTQDLRQAFASRHEEETEERKRTRG